jgi:hypothetical protein
MGLNPREKLMFHFMVPMRPWKGVVHDAFVDFTRGA